MNLQDALERVELMASGDPQWDLSQNDRKALKLVLGQAAESSLPTQASREARPANCPTCGSPAPKRHPAMQFEGEVQPCKDHWHAYGEGLKYVAPAEPTQRGMASATSRISLGHIGNGIADAIKKYMPNREDDWDLLVDAENAVLAMLTHGAKEQSLKFWNEKLREAEQRALARREEPAVAGGADPWFKPHANCDWCGRVTHDARLFGKSCTNEGGFMREACRGTFRLNPIFVEQAATAPPKDK